MTSPTEENRADTRSTLCPRCKHRMWVHAPPQLAGGLWGILRKDVGEGCTRPGCPCVIPGAELMAYPYTKMTD